MFVPSPLFGSLMAGGFGAGSAYLVYLATLFFRRTDTAFFGAIFILVSALPACLGIRAWRSRRTPLSIEVGGRITYGEREICGVYKIAPRPGCALDELELALFPILPIESARISVI